MYERSSQILISISASSYIKLMRVYKQVNEWPTNTILFS